MKVKNLKVIDLFSGCGGLSNGFSKAGFDIVAGIDNWEDALKTFAKNHGESKVFNFDLYDKERLRDLYKKENLRADVVIGGPPCQGFSIAGKRDVNDKRNQLYNSFLVSLEELQPNAFLMENVPNLKSMDNGSVFEKIKSDFEKLGYNVSSKILLASNYGVPQNRRRLFIVGLKNGIFEFPKETHIKNKVTTKDAISDLPETSLKDGENYLIDPKTGYQKLMRTGSCGVYNHIITEHKQKTIDTISLVPDGGNYKDLPERLKDTRKVNIAWTRMNSRKPSFTIDTGHNHHFHYKWNRVPTARESARIQSFSDDFIFLGGKTSQLKQVGNAVPPLLAKVVAEQLKKYLL